MSFVNDRVVLKRTRPHEGIIFVGQFSIHVSGCLRAINYWSAGRVFENPGVGFAADLSIEVSCDYETLSKCHAQKSGVWLTARHKRQK